MAVEITCPHCRFSRSVPREKIPPGTKWAVCPSCGRRFTFPLAQDRKESPGGSPLKDGPFQESHGEWGEAPRLRGAPWEDRGSLGLWASIFGTVKAALFAPAKLFASLPCGAGLGDPFAFGLLFGSTGSMFSLFWQFLMFSGGLFYFASPYVGQLGKSLIFLGVMVLVPFLVTAAMFAYTAVLHVLLLIVGAGGGGFEATFRVVSYSQAAQVWSIIPFVGGWIGGAWQVIIQIIGLREIHRTSYLRVLLAFLIPIIIFFLLLAAVLIPVFLFLYNHAPGQPWA